MSLSGSVESLAKFASNLRELPKVVAQKVTTAAAPAITDIGRASFDAGETPYGVSWDLGADGQRVTLRKTGALASGLRYVAIGTKLRVALTVAYAKYQIGKRPVFPRQGGSLPATYVDKLREVSAEVVRAELDR